MRVMKRIFSIIAAAMIAGSVFITTGAFVASAAPATENIAKSSIDDDLVDLDTGLYPPDPNGKHSILSFQEYCYTERAFSQQYYGLYIYVYNPTEVPIRTRSVLNVVNMATEYDVSGKPTSYRNVRLEYLDCSMNSRFYKFRISSSDVAEIFETEKAYNARHDKRRYDIAGLQLSFEGDEENYTVDETVAWTFYFDGYAKGLGRDPFAGSTLRSEVKKLETVSLDVHHTFYRMPTAYKDWTYEEVDTVYFTVPERYFRDYGNLQKIKAEWYEYKTNPIFVITGDEDDAFDDLSPYIGSNIGETDANLKWTVVWEESHSTMVDSTYYEFDKGYNKLPLPNDSFNHVYYSSVNANFLPRMDYLFDNHPVRNDDEAKVTSAELKEYMASYTQSHGGERIEAVEANYSKNLFADSIDADRIGLLADQTKTNGYICYEFDAEESYDLLEPEDVNLWDRFLISLGLKRRGQQVAIRYSPIEVLKDGDITANESNKTRICSDYLLNEDDYEDFSSVYNGAGDKARTVLFRFANTDYYFSNARFEDTETGGMSSIDGYVAQETVFFDFDIIQLTFRKDATQTIIPVVANPQDIINDVTVTEDFKGYASAEMSWLKKLLSIALLLLLIVIILLFAPGVIDLLSAIIALPFKLVAGIIDSLNKK